MNKVTIEDMKKRITNTDYHLLEGTTITICNITLDNGFSVRGESACVDPSNYDKKIGENIAYDRAINSMWPLFGFLLAEDIYRKKILDKTN